MNHFLLDRKNKSEMYSSKSTNLLEEKVTSTKSSAIEQTIQFNSSKSLFTKEKEKENYLSYSEENVAVLEPSPLDPQIFVQDSKYSKLSNSVPILKEEAILTEAKVEENKNNNSETKSTFVQIKSYANILSTGISRVKNVFKQKSKEDSSSDKEQNVSPAIPKVSSEPYIVPKVDEPTLHPEIPGLVFKQDLERRNSKKKRRSRIFGSNLDTDDFKSTDDKQLTPPETIECIETSAIVQNSNTLEEHSFDSVLLDSKADSSHETNSKSNTLKRRPSKKKKESVEKKFNDEIDQALHEIKLMELEATRKLSSEQKIKIESKRPSFKSKTKKTSFQNQKSEDSGNTADDEKPHQQVTCKTINDINRLCYS